MWIKEKLKWTLLTPLSVIWLVVRACVCVCVCLSPFAWADALISLLLPHAAIRWFHLCIYLFVFWSLFFCNCWPLIAHVASSWSAPLVLDCVSGGWRCLKKKSNKKKKGLLWWLFLCDRRKKFPTLYFQLCSQTMQSRKQPNAWRK